MSPWIKTTIVTGVASSVLATVMPVAASDVRLTDAIKSQDHAAIRALLDGGVDVNAPSGDGATALHWAVRWDDARAVDLLLAHGASVDAANDYGVTPLALACINGGLQMVVRLLTAGADPDAVTSMGETVLMTCSRTGSVDAVIALLEHGASTINATEKSRGQTALMWAVAQGYPAVAKVLIEHGANIHARTETRSLLVSLDGVIRSRNTGTVTLGGFTPLLFAARQGSVESAALLLDAGAEVDETTPDGASVLAVASLSGHYDLAAFLIERGADLNTAGAGYAPLHAAVLRGDQQLVKTLLAHGADPNVRVTKATRVPRHTNWWVFPSFVTGGTPYLLAAKWAEVEIMRLLYDHGADPSVTTFDGTTALMMAAGARWRNTEMDRRNRAVPTEVAEAMHADQRPNMEAVKLVLEFGADVNAQNESGDTALHAAVYKAWPDVVELLVAHGGRLDLPNKAGKTAADTMCHDEDGQLAQCPGG